MINQTTATKLVKIYLTICQKYDNYLQYFCQRFSNNNEPVFTDQEVITIYLFCTSVEHKYKIKEMYNFIKDYWLDWFPKILSYQAFNNRLNRLSEVFKHISIEQILIGMSEQREMSINILDSCPIVTCKGKGKGKVARDFTDKSYCSSKKMWYYGVKLHALGAYQKGTLPYLKDYIVTKASENDLSVFKENWQELTDTCFIADKIYQSAAVNEVLKSNNSEMITPIKMKKNKSEVLKQRDFAFESLYNKAVSSIKQPIESFFNWLNEKTQIQYAGKVRSSKGLFVHIFGKIATALLFENLF